MKGFASDNYAGALPEVMQAIAAANTTHARSYGADEVSERVQALFSTLLGRDVAVRFVFNGTGANVLSMSLCTHSYSAIMCSDIAHLYADESSAPETFTGCRVMAIATGTHGKLTPELLSARLLRLGDLHYAQPSVVTLTQATEYGTVYSLEEIKNMSRFCQQLGLYLHVDGARILNACAGLGVTPKEMITECGVDIVSFGGTKAGMLYGEAVVILHDDLKKQAPYKHKQSMQLASKNRFIAAQFEALLRDDTGLKQAAQANEKAQLLAKGLAQFAEITITQPVQANGVFAIFPKPIIAPLQAQFPFYVWDELKDEVRLMCSWDTTEEEIELFLQNIRYLLS